jgi:uncharacterized protein YdeI (YjbR/CyaY-like superfamily)
MTLTFADAGEFDVWLSADVPPALAEALAADPAAAAAFAALSRSARYNIFLPLLKARTAATRATALRRALADLRTDAD